VPSLPSWFEITYTPAESIVNYSLNSSVNYASTSWRLWGTNDDVMFYLVNESINEALVANVPKYYPITCTGYVCYYSFSKYYLELWEGFTNPVATLNLTFITYGTCEEVSFVGLGDDDIPKINRIALVGVVMASVCGFVIINHTRRKKGGDEQ